MKQVEVKVFTDFACPFCYVGHKMIEKIRDDLKDNVEVIIKPYFMEIHPEVDGAGWETSRIKTNQQYEVINRSLELLGSPYGIEPKLGDHMASSRKAIILRAYIASEFPEKLSAYDEAVFDTYTVKLRNIGRDEVLQSILDEIGAETEVAAGLSNTMANIRFELDRASAMENYINETPTFIIGSKRVSGAVEKEALIEMIK
jgi:predicted DsbA family dithiol-disulfide isomerase